MVSDRHPLKLVVDDFIPSGPKTGPEGGWVDMAIKWLITKSSVGSQSTVFAITDFRPGSRHEVHRHPHAEETEYLVEGEGVARIGADEVVLRAGEIVFVPRNAYHGFRNASKTGNARMVWCYGGAASLEEAGYALESDDLVDREKPTS